MFLFLLTPMALLAIGWYLYWRKEERKTLFCPACGRRYAKEQGPACPEDGSTLKNVG